MKYGFALIFSLLFSATSSAQITFDAASGDDVLSGTSISYNHTISGSSVLLVVGVHTFTGADIVNTPTYNGVPLTLIDKVMIGSPQAWVYQYALANAPQGTHVLSVTTSTAVDFAVVSASYRGVDGLPADNFTKKWTVVGESPISATTTLTTNVSNTWTILVGAATGAPIGAGAGATLRASSGVFSAFPYADRLGIFDSNGPITQAGSTSMTVTGAHSYTEFGTVMASFAAAETSPGTLPRVYSQNITYQGGFRVPTTCNGGSLLWGGGAIAMNPAGNGGSGSLYIKSSDNKVAEISIPGLVDSADVNTLNTASCIQGFVEPTEGRKSQGNAAGDPEKPAHPSGMLVADGKLWINNGVYYDAGSDQYLSVMSRPLNLQTTGQVKGLYGLYSSSSGFKPSMATKSIAQVSVDWIDALGGKNLLLSKFNWPIIDSQSYGPDAILTDTATLVGPEQTTYPADATPLYYPAAHSLSGDAGQTNGTVYTTFSQAHSDGSLVQPKGTSSLLVFQVAGATRGAANGGYGFGYGCGCKDQVAPGSATCPSDATVCTPEGYYYDPERVGDKGTHGYPYVYQVVAYDMNDLVAVKNGTKMPWEPRPYTYWEFTFRISPPFAWPTQLSNAAYDAATNNIYIAQVNCCDWLGLDPKPLIHVFHVTP